MEVKSEVKEEKKCNEDYLSFQNPCNYFQEFMRAVLNCLGFTYRGGEDGGSSQVQADPPSSAAADPPVAEAALLAPPRAPPRPPISGGSGPQTNTNPN